MSDAEISPKLEQDQFVQELLMQKVPWTIIQQTFHQKYGWTIGTNRILRIRRIIDDTIDHEPRTKKELCEIIRRLTRDNLILKTALNAIDKDPKFIQKILLEKLEPISHLYVYMIQNKDFIKIGQSKDPYLRLRGLQTGSSDPLALLFWSNYYSEDELHDKFNMDRYSGEWFVYSNAIKDFIVFNTKIGLNKAMYDE